MPDSNFINPLQNPILWNIIFRAGGILLIGFLVIFALSKGQWKTFKESKLGAIYLGWLILIPLYLAGILLGGIPSLIALLILMLLAIRETVQLAKLNVWYGVSLVFLAVWSILVASFFQQFFYSLPLFYFLVITAVAIKLNNEKEGFSNASISLFISIWIIFSLSHGVLLGHLNNTIDNSKSLLLLIVFVTTLSDIGAYVVGKFFHRIQFLDSIKIASNISPHKTYIGVLGHILGAGLGIFVMYFAVGSYFSVSHWVLIAILSGIFGVVGGLTNSLFKRYFKAKDSSTIIPGHGGVLDRIDSITRVVILVYYYFLFFH